MGFSRSFHNRITGELLERIESVGLLSSLEEDGLQEIGERQQVTLMVEDGLYVNGNEIRFPSLDRRQRAVGYGLFDEDELLFEVPLTEAKDLPVDFPFVVDARAISFVP